MPKDVLEIKAFESGNIYNADDRDIPDDAAVYSENIDPYGQSGSLMAIQADATAIKSDVDAKRMAMINNNGTHQLAYIDNSDGYLKQIADVYAGSPAISNLDASNLGAGTIPAMQTNNKEVHIGLGQTKDVKWVGNIPHSQFGGSVPSGLQSENAELVKPSPFPAMHTVVNDSSNTHVYGIQQSGNYIYKFDVSKGVLIRRSEYFFTKTLAMCLASDNNLWVIDEVSSNLIVLKIDLDNMDVVTSRPLNAFTDDTYVTDIMECGSVLWLAQGNRSTINDYLWNIPVSSLTTSSSASTVTSRTPYKGADASSVSPNIGDWGSSLTSDTTTAPDFSLPKLPLVRVTGSNDYIGIVVKPVPDGAYVKWYYGSGTDFIGYDNSTTNASSVKGQIRYFLQVVKNDITANDKLNHLGNKGLVYAFSSDFNAAYGSVYLTKQDTNSTYLNWIERGTSGSQSTLYRLTKVAYNHNQTTIVGGTRNTIGANIDIDDAVLDEKSNSYNVFAGTSQARWAAGTSGALAIKAEGEVVLTISDNADVDGSINPSHDQFYATSFTYDGYQESPLSSWTHIDNGSISQDALNVKIDIYKANLSKRVTHVNLYRSSASVGTATQPSGFFRLVKSVSLKSGWLATDSNTTNPNWGSYYSKTIIDSGASYASYESRTGISEALINTMPKYGLSAKVNNFLYITDCSHIDIDDATNYLFKSRPFNFDQFNWAKDFLLLPSKATAMESFNGRLYVFSENETYVVNPDGMYIEDTIKGIGCRNQNGVVSSEIGMCFIDKNSIYLHNGQNINDIGAKIKKAHQIDDTNNSYSSLEKLCKYSASDYTGDIVIAYDSYRKAFCFFYTYKYNTYSSFTHAVSTVDTSEYITHGGSPSSTIQVGQAVSGTGIPANTTILEIQNANTFEISNPATATGNITLTITTTTINYAPQCLVYTVPKNRWDVWNRTNSSTTTDFNTYGAVHGKNNELFVSDTDNGLIQPFDPTNTTRLDNFLWYSKKFTMGESTSDKRIYKAEILSEDNTPTITVNTAENSDVYSALSTARTARHAQVKLAVTGDSTATIDALRFVFRRLKRTKAMS